MSKHLVPFSLSLPPHSVLLILTCRNSCRDVETLAQRVKRAKASAGGQPPAGASRAPLGCVSSPLTPRRHVSGV